VDLNNLAIQKEVNIILVKLVILVMPEIQNLIRILLRSAGINAQKKIIMDKKKVVVILIGISKLSLGEVMQRG